MNIILSDMKTWLESFLASSVVVTGNREPQDWPAFTSWLVVLDPGDVTAEPIATSRHKSDEHDIELIFYMRGNDELAFIGQIKSLYNALNKQQFGNLRKGLVSGGPARSYRIWSNREIDNLTPGVQLSKTYRVASIRFTGKSNPVNYLD